MDKRIIDFSSGNNTLPEEFIPLETKRMIYACGDAYGGFVKGGNNLKKTNIEVFSKLGFNVFCCVGKSSNNIDYLTSKPELNIVLCILTGNVDIDYPILEDLFPNMLDLISTDDIRFYPSAKVAFTMLKNGGICEKVSRAYVVKGTVYSGRVYPGDFQWGNPNFSIVSIDKTRRLTFKKVGKTFNTRAIYTNNIPNNTSNNENIARRLQQTFDDGQRFVDKSWENWHTRHAYNKGGFRRSTKKLKKTPRQD